MEANKQNPEERKLMFSQISLTDLSIKIRELIRDEIAGLLKSQKQPDEKKYLTRNEVLEILQISQSTLHRWMKSGKLRSYQIGSRVFYKAEEIEQAMYERDFLRGKC